MNQQIMSNIVSEYDGHPLSVLEVIPGKVRGVVQLVHGMSEYKERYLPFMEYLADRGLACVIHDHRGHGASVYSAEDLGYMYNGGGEGILSDILQINNYIHRRWENLPVILFGHSMGSLAVRSFARKYDDCIDLLIVCGSPSRNSLVKIGKLLAGIQKKVFGGRHRSKLIEDLSFGSFAARFPEEHSRNSWICGNPAAMAEYSKSPLCGFTFTVDGYQALFQLLEWTYRKDGWVMNHPYMPILFVAGSEDPCISSIRKFSQAVQFMRQRGYKDVKGKLYPGLRHEILNELEKEQVYRDIYCYIKKKLFVKKK